jgi:poly(A) polymerase
MISGNTTRRLVKKSFFFMEQYKKALFIVQTLQNAGHIAYFAGGWVRDYLLHTPSDDIDIATSATPDVVKSLFPKTIPIGIAFGIQLVVIESHSFEVATFRKESDYQDGRHPSHIEFSDAKQDALRRDFTINGMFFDPVKEEVLDFVEGKKDLEKKILRAIGDPSLRFHEDRLRMVRAARLSTRFGFSIEKNTKEAIERLAHELFPAVAVERVWAELVKMDLFPHLKEGLLSLFTLGLLSAIFPILKDLLKTEIEKRLTLLDQFPKVAPLIAKILELFPSYSLDEKIALCQFFKLSKNETHFVLILDKAKQLVENKSSLQQWAHFYAIEESSLALDIYSLHLSAKEKTLFLSQNAERKKTLSKAILRLQKKDPVLKSEFLKELGVLPGKKMGLLLQEAEKIAIEENLEDPRQVFEKLKKTALWSL